VLMTLEREVYVEMFHGDEVNEEAALSLPYGSYGDACVRSAL